MKETLEDFYKYMDAMLLYLSTVPDSIPLRPEIIAEKAGLNIERTTAYLLCAYMSRQEYLKKTEVGIFYSLKGEGFLFIKTGGYIQEMINENAENIRLGKLERSQRANQIAVIWLTVILAVSALIAAIFAIAELYWKYHWFH